MQLKSGALITTWENYSLEPPKVYFPIYKSTDTGASWTQISNVEGNNQLVCYYSDQRDSKYGEKLAHQTTTDLKTWSSILVDDVHETNSYAARPGMTAITQLPHNDYSSLHFRL
jgi:hypothetical protein